MKHYYLQMTSDHLRQIEEEFLNLWETFDEIYGKEHDLSVTARPVVFGAPFPYTLYYYRLDVPGEYMVLTKVYRINSPDTLIAALRKLMEQLKLGTAINLVALEGVEEEPFTAHKKRKIS